jgi:hypothetical protein
MARVGKVLLNNDNKNLIRDNSNNQLIMEIKIQITNHNIMNCAGIGRPSLQCLGILIEPRNIEHHRPKPFGNIIPLNVELYQIYAEYC